ncbi:phospholipase A I-like protein [Tanacetum coccineum]
MGRKLRKIRNLVAPPTNNTYVPFGASLRMCPGIKLVKMETSVMIHLLPGIIIVALLLVNESVNAKNLTNPSDFSINSGSYNDIFVVAEPGELAEKFLQNIKYNFQSMLRGRRRRYMSDISHINIVADLVASKPCFHIEAVVHRFMGRQTQICFLVMEQNGQVWKRSK